MKTAFTAIALLLVTLVSQAEDIPETPQHPVSIGDSWTFKRVSKGQITVQSRTIFKIAEQGADDQYIIKSLSGEVSGNGPTVWRQAGRVDTDTCMIDFFGGSTLGITHSCSTAFVPGMDWNTEAINKETRTTQRYQVIGEDEVTVGAGTFQALKIESHWEVAKAVNTGKASPKYGPPLRYHFVYWYAPETKTMVKAEREFRNPAGAVETRSTDELEAFRVQNPR